MQPLLLVVFCLLAACAAKPTAPQVQDNVRKLPLETARSPARTLGPHPLPDNFSFPVEVVAGQPVAPISAQPTSTRKQQPPLSGHMDSAPLIIGGADAYPGQFPWQAGIRMDDKYFCGGSIISDTWILTAGHCVDGFTRFQVWVGTVKSNNDAGTSTQTFITTQKHLHPHYNPDFIDNDIALLTLTGKHIVFSSELVRPVRLPSYSLAQNLLEGEMVFISGWGRTSDTSSVSPVLKYVDLKIVPNEVCEEVYGNTVIRSKICCSTENIKSTCNGDSGGPLVMKEGDGEWTEVGIVSFGHRDGCTKKYPVAFTRVSSFLQFIEDTTNIAIRD